MPTPIRLRSGRNRGSRENGSPVWTTAPAALECANATALSRRLCFLRRRCRLFYASRVRHPLRYETFSTTVIYAGARLGRRNSGGAAVRCKRNQLLLLLLLRRAPCRRLWKRNRREIRSVVRLIYGRAFGRLRVATFSGSHWFGSRTSIREERIDKIHTIHINVISILFLFVRILSICFKNYGEVIIPIKPPVDPRSKSRLKRVAVGCETD